jgi:phospholipid/cholesterol/gamma-HCH transport system substrate-binding protein
MAISNPVTINGLQVGKIYDLRERNRSLNGIVATINLMRDVDIPDNSYATVRKDLLGSATISITLGDSKTNMKNGDTLLSKNSPGFLDEMRDSVNPTLAIVNNAVKALDSLLRVVGTYFDPATKNNFHTIIGNLTKTSADLAKLADAQNSALSKSLNNVNEITANLAKNNDKINQTLDNVQKATGKFANAKIEETMATLQETLAGLKGVLAKANSRDGSLGLLLNDPKLYRNLENTTYKLNILLDDFRTHPKRYVNVSVFGKKDKSEPLSAPLQDDSTGQSPQKKK